MRVWASSGGSGETARMRRLAWTFAARIGDKYQIRLARPKSTVTLNKERLEIKAKMHIYILQQFTFDCHANSNIQVVIVDIKMVIVSHFERMLAPREISSFMHDKNVDVTDIW